MNKFIQKIKDFASDVRIELGKVAFPTKNETLLTTTVVIMFVLVFSIVLALVDSMLVNIVKMVI